MPKAHKEVEEALAPFGVDATSIAEFTLLSMAEEADVVREAAKLIHERIDGYAKLLEDLVAPDTNVAAMNECSFFTETELQNVRSLYRRLMRLRGRYLESDLEATKDSYGAYVSEALRTWNEQRGALRAIAHKIREGWEREEPLYTERSYFG